LKILVVDDEPDVRKSLSKFLKKLGHTVYCAVNGLEGLQQFHSRKLNLVITDLRMPGMDGLELLRRIKTVEQSPVDIIVITGHGDMDNAIKALKYGAFDYLQKPINIRELAITIERSAEYASLRNNYIKLKREFKERVDWETKSVRGEAEQLREAYLEEIGLDGLYVYSEAMHKVVQQAEKYSSDRSIPLLIEGESGTGKELIARYTHHFGHGSSLRPFIAISCGAVSPGLIEEELFGHEPGAYTGASPKGRIDLNDLSFVRELTPDFDFNAKESFALGRDKFELPEDMLDLEDLTRQIIKKALEKKHGKQTRTAQYLGISRRVLQGRLKKMKIK
jgi:two-component system response regulator AtoC